MKSNNRMTVKKMIKTIGKRDRCFATLSPEDQLRILSEAQSDLHRIIKNSPGCKSAKYYYASNDKNLLKAL